MSILEIGLSATCVLIVCGAWWWIATRPEFGAWMAALAKRHSKEAEQEVMKAWFDGYAAGQEYEQLKGSRPTK